MHHKPSYKTQNLNKLTLQCTERAQKGIISSKDYVRKVIGYLLQNEQLVNMNSGTEGTFHSTICKTPH